MCVAPVVAALVARASVGAVIVVVVGEAELVPEVLAFLPLFLALISGLAHECLILLLVCL